MGHNRTWGGCHILLFGSLPRYYSKKHTIASLDQEIMQGNTQPAEALKTYFEMYYKAYMVHRLVTVVPVGLWLILVAIIVLST